MYYLTELTLSCFYAVLNRTAAEGEAQIVEKLQNKTLRVTTVMVSTFISLFIKKFISNSYKPLVLDIFFTHEF